MSTLGHYCPKCHNFVVWSKPRHILERGVRKITPFSPYICTECGWRGWLASGRKIKLWRSVFIAIVIVGSVIALFVILSRLNEKLAVPPQQPTNTRAR